MQTQTVSRLLLHVRANVRAEDVQTYFSFEKSLAKGTKLRSNLRMNLLNKKLFY